MPRTELKNNSVKNFNLTNPKDNIVALPAVTENEEALAIFETLVFIIFHRYPMEFLTEADSFTVSNIALQLALYNKLMSEAMQEPIIQQHQSRSENTIPKENPAYTLAAKAWKSAETSLKSMSLNPKARMTLLSMARYIESDHGNKDNGTMGKWLETQMNKDDDD